MHPKQMMFMGLIFAAGTMISLTFGGAWIGTSEVDVVNSLTVFKQANILGLWSVMVPNIDFFLVGAKSLMMMDFAFFTGPMALLQWFLMMVFGIAFLWGFLIVIIGVIQGLWKR